MEKPKSILKSILWILSYILVAAVASCVTLTLFCRPTKLEQLEQIISQRFIGEVDTVAMEDAAATAMIAALGDRWSYYIPAAEYAEYMEGKSNSYVGIGITISKREDGQGFDVLGVTADGPADKAGMLPGDILVEADGQDLKDFELSDVTALIKGESGTEVTVAVLRDGEKLSFTITRKHLEATVAEGQMLAENVGYVRIENFHDHCAEQTIAQIDKLLADGAESLVLDVRNNVGGYVIEMVEILDYLLPEGLLFQSVRYNGARTDYTSDADCVELPMTVLVNGDSYSAAEFFAAALSEFEWATVVGEPTCGKSYFQNVFQLNDGSAVGLSVGEYFTPDGVSLADEGGLTPDVVVEVDSETAMLIYAGVLAPEQDPQILAAMETLKENG